MLRPIILASCLAVASGVAGGKEDTKATLAAEFGDEFRIVETDHWLIVTDASVASSADTAWVLERSYEIFYEEWSDFGAKPLVEPLVCISFADADGLSDYREKLGVGAPDGRGFYSLLTNRIVLCDEDKEPPGMVRQSKRAKGDTRKHSRTAHEAAHQLAFNSGVQTEGRPYPAWFGEGLAGNYEPVSREDSFGLTAERRSERIDVIKVLRKNDDLIPLSEFVGMVRDENAREMAQVLYPQAAAFFRFLYIEYHDEFKDYQKRLASLRIAAVKSETLEKAFTKAFGSIEDLEGPWEQYLDGLGERTVASKRPKKPKRRGVF